MDEEKIEDKTEVVEETVVETTETEKVEEKTEASVEKSETTVEVDEAAVNSAVLDEIVSGDKKAKKNAKKDKKPKKEVDLSDVKSLSDLKKKTGFGIKFGEIYGKIQSNIGVLAIVFVAAILVMGLSATAIFLSNVKGPEQVLVPNVVGKKLEDALLEMQVKELYPKINLRYSNTPGDEGTILEQSPESGAIVKGYSRVNLVVSRGVVVDKVGNYIGMNLDEVRMNLQTLFAGTTRPLIVLADPLYKPDPSDAGTILEQDPPEGTNISSPVTVQLIVSRGPNYDNTRAPYLIGQNVNDVLQTIARSKIIFDFTYHIAEENEKAGTVVSQDTFTEEFIPNYSRVNIEFALPSGTMNDNVYGIFKADLSDYPYPVPMRLDAVPQEGNSYTILNFSHSGGSVTIPYAVPAGTKLVLYVVDKATSSIIVN